MSQAGVQTSSNIKYAIKDQTPVQRKFPNIRNIVQEGGIVLRVVGGPVQCGEFWRYIANRYIVICYK